jgi:cysteine desulfurase
VSFAGVESTTLLSLLPEVAASTGSACHAGRTEPSAVLLAMGVAPELALGAVRFSLGRWTTEEEVDRVIPLLVERVRSLRDTGSAG